MMGALKKTIHTPEYASFCKDLRKSREGAGLSQRALADRLGVPHSWVAKVETGERRIDVIECCRFIGACGGDARAIFDRVARQLSGSSAKGSRQ